MILIWHFLLNVISFPRINRNCFVVVGYVIFSISLNFESRWKLWFEVSKCMHAKNAFFALLSFLWFQSRKSKAASFLPTYCSFVNPLPFLWRENFFFTETSFKDLNVAIHLSQKLNKVTFILLSYLYIAAACILKLMRTWKAWWKLWTRNTCFLCFLGSREGPAQ